MRATSGARAFAPAKVNLALHVTGHRADGYHLLDSLVVFADLGDRISVLPSTELSLSVSGPRAAGVPTDDSNLVLRAARGMGITGAAIHLEKHLPAAAGIGGGSSDAAATLRALAEASGMALPPDRGLSLGADVPVCLLARPCRMQGIGEDVTQVPALPSMHLVLVNPGVSVPTGPVFQGLQRKNNPPMPADFPRWRDAAGFAVWLSRQRNDLEPPARALAPVITQVLADLQGADGCLLARMSGSGATCFGIYADPAQAEHAARSIGATHPEWWCRAAGVYRPDASEDPLEPADWQEPPADRE